MKVGVTYKGIDKLEQKMARLGRSGELATYKRIVDIALTVHGKAKKSIQDLSPGHSAVRYKPKRTVVVSPKGKAPNTDTGRLVNSVKLVQLPNKLMVQVGSNLKYARALELGAKTGRNHSAVLLPRPWLMPAVRSTISRPPTVSSKVREELTKGLKR